MKNQRGFGIVEVLLSFVIVVVTAGSLLQLNKLYLEYTRDGRDREIALRLAESKLEELKSFGSIDGYREIVDSPSTENVEVNGEVFKVSWDVSGYSWDESLDPKVWVSDASVDADKKTVEVTVRWGNTSEDDPKTFVMVSDITKELSISGGPFGSSGDNFGLGKGGPDVIHEPGSIPTVIPIELGDGLKQESSRPLPEVMQQGNSNSLRVNFDNVVYGDGNILMQRQDLTSVSCSCVTDGSGQGDLPSLKVILNDLSYWVKGGEATKPKGRQGNNQDPLCGACCQHHYDADDNTFAFENVYDVFKWYAADGSHPHTIDNNNYLEVCRFIRINGVYEMANDWNLIALNVFDGELLSDTNSAVQVAYQDYIKETVLDYTLLQIEAGGDYDNSGVENYQPESFHDYLVRNPVTITDDGERMVNSTDINVFPGPRQLVARGIYVDIVSPEYRGKLSELSDNAQTIAALPENFLRYVPFYEVNLTLLANWTSADKGIVDVSSEDVQTIVDTSQNYYGVYSRGVIDAIRAGKSVITADIKKSNSGIAAVAALTPLESSDAFKLSSEVTVTVNDEGDFFSISGPVFCINYAAPANKCNDIQFANIKLALDSDNTVCTKATTGNGANQTTTYACYTNSPGNFTLSASFDGVDTPVEFVPGPQWGESVPEPENGGTLSIAGDCILVVLNRSSQGLPSSCVANN